MYKISRAAIYFTLLAAFIIEGSVLNHIRIFGAAPDLVLIIVIFFGSFLGGAAGLEAGIFAGILRDIFAFDFFGINMFVLGITGLVVGGLNTKFSRDSQLTQVILVFLFTVFSLLMHFGIVSMFSSFTSLGLGEYFMISVLPVSIYTTLISIPVFSQLIRIFNLKMPEEFI